MKLKLIAASVLCSAALFSAVDAQAASPFTANDLILCFDSTGGTGASTDLEIDLGNYQSVNDMNSGHTLALNSILNSVYGSSWSTDGDVSWGVVGANNTLQSIPGSTVFITDVTGDSAFSQPISQQHSAALAIFSIYNAGGLTAAGGGLTGGTISNTASTSFDVNYDLSGATGSGIGDEEGDILLDNINGSTTTQDLYDIVPETNSSTGGSVTDINTFSLDTNGTFTAAVPEPSTWATVILGIGALVGLRFRRRNA